MLLPSFHTNPGIPHNFNHVITLYLLENGYDIRAIQEVLVHQSVKTKIIYTEVKEILLSNSWYFLAKVIKL